MRIPLASKGTTSALLACLALLTACSSNFLKKSGSDTESMQRRLFDIGLPLLVQAAEWCPFEAGSTYGFFLRGQNLIDASSIPQAIDASHVAYIHPRLPAASAGLKVDDHIVEVNATNVEQQAPASVMHLIQRLTSARIQPLQLKIERNGRRETLTMRAVPACEFSLRVVKSEQINGMTDGRQIGITSGAIHFFVWDDELAWLVAHEIAHNLLSHVQSAKLQRMLDTFLTATTGAPKRPLNAAEPGSREVQADYVGAYLIARAGYDLDAIRRAWDRFSRVEVRHTPVGTPGFPSTHPTTAERLAAFDHTLHEIEDKRRRGQSLEPRLKPTP